MPRDDQVLVKVHVAALNPFDWHMTTGKPYLMRPSTGFGAPERSDIGGDYAGTVEAVGLNVTAFKVGDAVFGDKFGALAEFIAVREHGAIAHLPDGLTFEQGSTHNCPPPHAERMLFHELHEFA